MTVYDIGDQPIVTAAFTDAAGEPDDPTAITFSLKAPNGTVVTATEAAATNPVVGTWEWSLPSAFDAAGAWYVRVEATAGLQTAEEMTIRVQRSNVVA